MGERWVGCMWERWWKWSDSGCFPSFMCQPFLKLFCASFLWQHSTTAHTWGRIQLGNSSRASTSEFFHLGLLSADTMSFFLPFVLHPSCLSQRSWSRVLWGKENKTKQLGLLPIQWSLAVEVFHLMFYGLFFLFPQLLQYEMCLNIEDIDTRLKSLDTCRMLVNGMSFLLGGDT